MAQTASSSLTVQDYLDQLQAERNAEWPEERLTAQAASITDVVRNLGSG